MGLAYTAERKNVHLAYGYREFFGESTIWANKSLRFGGKGLDGWGHPGLFQSEVREGGKGKVKGSLFR